MTGDLPTRLFRTREAWAVWLGKNHSTSQGIWLQLAKKASGSQSVTYVEAVEVALCHGWIDGQKKSESEKFWLQKFTPRSRKSLWSKINREKAQALIEAGHMKPAGLAEIERARQDGRWVAAYDSPSGAAVPEDFQAALDRSVRARDFFNALDRANRYALLFRIQTARKAETRARRIQQFILMLQNHEKIHP